METDVCFLPLMRAVKRSLLPALQASDIAYQYLKSYAEKGGYSVGTNTYVGHL